MARASRSAKASARPPRLAARMMNIVARAYGAPTYTISASAINTAASTTTRRRVIAVHLTLVLFSNPSHAETDHRHRRTIRCRQGHRVASAGADARLQTH